MRDRRPTARFAALLFGLVLSACGGTPANDEQPGLTASEEHQLDADADMLDSQREDYEAGLARQAQADAAARPTADGPDASNTR